MEIIIDILSDLRSDIDFASANGILSEHLIDSIDFAILISELEAQFEIEIGMEYMEKEHFDSPSKIWKMVQEILEKEER